MTQDQIQTETLETRVVTRPPDYERGIRERFGGIDTPAALGGMFAALGVMVLLGALIGLTALPYQLNAIGPDGNTVTLETAGIAVATVVIFVAFFVGGWAAARISRFDGVINGIGVALWMLLLVALSAAAGLWIEAEYGFLQRAGLPDWLSQLTGDVTTLAVVGAILAVAALIIGSILGGARGEAYNRRVETAMSDGRGTYVEHEVR